MFSWLKKHGLRICLRGRLLRTSVGLAGPSPICVRQGCLVSVNNLLSFLALARFEVESAFLRPLGKCKTMSRFAKVAI